MLNQKTVSGVKLFGLGSLALLSLSGLLIGSFLALMLWLPSEWAVQVSKAVLPGIPVANLDVFRIFYVSAYQIIVPLVLCFSAFSMGLSVYLGRRLRASPKKVAYVMAAVTVLSLMIFASLTPATMAISSTQTAEYNQFNNQPCTYYVFTDGTNYYAQDCSTGVIAYGGPLNAGGATGTDAGSVIDKAIVSANSGGGGIVSMGAGSFTATSTILGKSNIVLTGQGIISTKILNGLSAQNTVLIGNSLTSAAGTAIKNFTLSNMALDMNGQSGTGPITIQNSYNITLDHLSVYGGVSSGSYDSISLSGNTNLVVSYCSFTTLYNAGGATLTRANFLYDYFTNFYNNGLLISSGTNILVLGNTINMDPESYGIDLGISTYVRVQGNYIFGNTPAVGDNGIYTESGNNIEIVGNTLQKAIIQVQANNSLISGNQIVAPSIQNGGAITIGPKSPATTITHIIVIGNTIFGVPTHTLGGGGGIQLANTKFSTVTGNDIYNTGNNTGKPAIGLITSSFNVIQGNEIDTANQGIVESSSSNNNLISGNILQTITSTKIGFTGASTISIGNIGYNPLGALTNPFKTGRPATTWNYIPDSGGNSTTPMNSTTTTVRDSPKLIIFSQTATDTAGETTTIKIDGTAVPSINGVVLSSGFTFAVVLQPGETYYATWHTGDASWLVSGQ